MIWFTSDQHFGHANIIKHCSRPFSTTVEMDEAMIARWNSVVDDHDYVYHLGDFTLGTDVNIYARRLQGQIRFVTPPFHHDKRWLASGLMSALNIAIYPYMHYDPYIGSKGTFMCHYPVAVWERKHYGSWHLYGHIHNKEYVLPGFTFNVGVDHNNFTPVSYFEIQRHMEQLGWSPDWTEFNNTLT